jgi:hypothetical protein
MDEQSMVRSKVVAGTWGYVDIPATPFADGFRWEIDQRQRGLCCALRRLGKSIPGAQQRSLAKVPAHTTNE